jgi:hypothetical protein
MGDEPRWRVVLTFGGEVLSDEEYARRFNEGLEWQKKYAARQEARSKHIAALKLKYQCTDQFMPDAGQTERIAAAFKRGATIRELMLIFGYYSDGAIRHHLRKAGLINPPRRHRTPWNDVLPPQWARAQTAWELGRRIIRAQQAGVTLAEIARALKVSAGRVRQIWARARSPRASQSPLERYLAQKEPTPPT